MGGQNAKCPNESDSGENVGDERGKSGEDEGEEKSEDEETDAELIDPPGSGEVIVKGTFCGHLITCNHILDAALPLHYKLPIASLVPALEAIRDVKEEESTEATEGGAVLEKEAGDEKEPEEVLVDREDWNSLLKILSGDCVDMAKLKEDVHKKDMGRRALEFKKLWEAGQEDYNVLAKANETLEEELASTKRELAALRDELETLKAAPEENQEKQPSPVTSPWTPQKEPCDKACEKTYGSLEVDGNFVGHVKSENLALEICVPLKGNVSKKLALDAIHEFQMSGERQWEEYEEKKRQREEKKQKEDEEAEGEEEGEEEEEEEELVQPPMTSEAWNDLLKCLASDATMETPEITQPRLLAKAVLGSSRGKIGGKITDLVTLAKKARENEEAQQNAAEGSSGPESFFIGDDCHDESQISSSPDGSGTKFDWLRARDKDTISDAAKNLKPCLENENGHGSDTLLQLQARLDEEINKQMLLKRDLENYEVTKREKEALLAQVRALQDEMRMVPQDVLSGRSGVTQDVVMLSKEKMTLETQLASLGQEKRAHETRAIELQLRLKREKEWRQKLEQEVRQQEELNREKAQAFKSAQEDMNRLRQDLEQKIHIRPATMPPTMPPTRSRIGISPHSSARESGQQSPGHWLTTGQSSDRSVSDTAQPLLYQPSISSGGRRTPSPGSLSSGQRQRNADQRQSHIKELEQWANQLKSLARAAEKI